VALRLMVRARRARFELEPDRPLAEYLRQHGQSTETLRALWRPLCLAALNTPPELASARLFLHVLGDAFYARRTNSDFLFPASDLGACLPRPAMDFIEARGGGVRLATRVAAVRTAANAATGVVVRNELLPARHVVLATAAHMTVELLREHEPMRAVVEKLDRLTAHPICTAYLQFPEHVTLGRDVIGLMDTTVQWLYDHGRLRGKPGLVAAVINGPGWHTRLGNESLRKTVCDEIRRAFPGWPEPLAIKLIREKRATLAAVPGVDGLRPDHTTAIRGLWLAGDYTATGYPSSLEGAVRSGLICARRILKEERKWR